MILLFALLTQFASADEDAPADAIQETRTSISETERQQREALAHLFVINQHIKDIAKKKARLNEKLMSQEAAVRSTAQDVAELEEKTEKHKEMLNHRLRQLYQGQSRNNYQWLFAAQTPIELERNHRFLRRMVDSDHHYVREYVSHLEHLKKKRSELATMVSKLMGMQKGAQGQELELTDQMRTKSRLVSELRKAKDSKLTKLKTLRTGAETEALDYAFFERKGSLKPPLEARVSREYGTFVDPQFRFRLMHKGNFYAAAQPQSVGAVFAGKVVLARQIPGYGQTVIIDHGDNYYTVYAFASQLKIREGVAVKEGDVIATSGHESPLFGPGLYFEIRHFTDAVDPRPWIKEPGIKTADAKGGAP